MADDFSRILNEVHSAQSSQNSFVMVHPITGEVMEGIGDGPLKWGEYPDTIEPGTDDSYQYDIFRSKYRPYPSDILSANSIGEITEQPEGSQINDPYWQIASRIMYEYTKTKQGDRPVDEFGSEEMAQWGVSFMNSFENNIPAMVINTAKLQDAPPEVSRAMYYLLETSDRDGILGSNIIESAGQMLIDPSTWLGLGTFGIGLAGRETGKALSKMGVKELLKNAITKQSVKTSTLALAGESAFFGAVDNLARQEVAIEAEQQDGLDLQQLGTVTAVSGALGETLGTLGPAALEGSKRVVKEIGKRLNAPGNMPTVGSTGGNIGTDVSYRMQHQPNEEGAPLFDMTGGGEVFPDDIYSSNGLRFYGNPNNEFDRESFQIIQKVRGNPEAEVTIYRAVPNEESISAINPGDFVTISKKYAELHGESGYGKDGTDKGKILSIKVKAKDLRSEGNDLNEFGYFPIKEPQT